MNKQNQNIPSTAAMYKMVRTVEVASKCKTTSLQKCMECQCHTSPDMVKIEEEDGNWHCQLLILSDINQINIWYLILSDITLLLAYHDVVFFSLLIM